jgi:hypothetical protein
VEKYWLKSMQVDSVDTLYKGTAGTPPPKDPNLVIAETKVQGQLAAKQIDLQIAQLNLQSAERIATGKSQEFIMSLQEEGRLNNAKIVELGASAQKLAADAQSEASYAQAALVNAQLAQLKHRNDSVNAALDRESKHYLAELDKQTRLAEKQMELERKAAEKTVESATKTETPKLPDIHVHMPSGKKKISKAADGSYMSEDA